MTDSLPDGVVVLNFCNGCGRIVGVSRVVSGNYVPGIIDHGAIENWSKGDALIIAECTSCAACEPDQDQKQDRCEPDLPSEHDPAPSRFDPDVQTVDQILEEIWRSPILK